MPSHTPRTAPRRLENGAIDLDFYVRRAHKLRGQETRHRLEHGARFFTRKLHLDK